ncbi:MULTISPECIES: hypothetical protein [unclassified Streptomyces]|uniref:hypothetical protein n=1 Tax=unclassified Streptomyces TaxID=2593676 RepID=UPI000C27EA32|nr:hypothetical protein CG719_24240 [Streptomyces sp. CB01373]
MNGPQEEARLAVRRARQRLTEDAAALMAASGEAAEIGMETRAEELRRAVLVAWSTGVAPEDIAQDAGVELRVIRGWAVPGRTRPGS